MSDPKTISITDVRLTTTQNPGRVEVWVCIDPGIWVLAISEPNVSPEEGCIDHYVTAAGLIDELRMEADEGEPYDPYMFGFE